MFSTKLFFLRMTLYVMKGAHCLKITQNVLFWILAFSTNFCPIKTDLPGNSVWPQASDFQKLAKMDDFWYFWLTFVYSRWKRSSLRSQCLMILFLWFSNLQFLKWHSDYILSSSRFVTLLRIFLVHLRKFWPLGFYVKTFT